MLRSIWLLTSPTRDQTHIPPRRVLTTGPPGRSHHFLAVHRDWIGITESNPEVLPGVRSFAAISTDHPPCPRNKPKKLINLPASHHVLQGWVELPVLKGISLHISDARVESLQLSRLRLVKVILCVPASRFSVISLFF